MTSEKKIKTIAIYIASLVLTITISISLTFAWIARQWNPIISQENIVVGTTGSLAIRVTRDNGDMVKDILYLSDLVENIDDVTLKQVSSYSGESGEFFELQKIPYVDPESGESIERYTIVRIKDNSTIITNKYVEFKFSLVSDKQDQRYVFVSNDSHMRVIEDLLPDRENYANPLRMSLTYVDGTDRETYLFNNGNSSTHKGITNEYTEYIVNGVTERLYYADDKPYYSIFVSDNSPELNTVDHSLLRTTGDQYDNKPNKVNKIYSFTDYDGGYSDCVNLFETIRNKETLTESQKVLTERLLNHYYYSSVVVGDHSKITNILERAYDDSFYNGADLDSIIDETIDDFVLSEYCINSEKCLFEMGNSNVQLVFRLWLEGEDPMCIDEIAGANYDFLFKFSSVVKEI